MAVSALSWYSQTNYGLGKDDDSSILLFGWRFMPTLVAVLYCQLTVMLFEDVKRTEPFSRMARPGGSSALSSILQGPRAWWHAVVDGFSPKKIGGRRSWLLVCSSLIYIIGFLAISPLSSSLLTSEDVRVKKATAFNRIVPTGSDPISLEPDRDTYFRTIGNVLHSTPTSAWISNSYFIMPFWPSEFKLLPLGPSLASTNRNWTAPTTIMTTDFQCEPMKFLDTGMNSRNRTLILGSENNTYAEIDTTDSLWFSMESSSGCKYSLELDVSQSMVRYGGVIWSNLSTLVANFIDGTDQNKYLQTNISADCLDRELLLVTTPWLNDKSRTLESAFPPNFTVHGELCSSYYYAAQLPTTAEILTPSSSKIVFNQEQYLKVRKPLSDDLLDVKKLHALAMDDDWAQYLTAPDSSLRPGQFNGVSSVLGLLHDFDVWGMVQARDLPSEARSFKQRFMGELLYSSLLQRSIAESQVQTAQGQSTFIERRVVVILGVGILMAAFFFVSFCLLVLAFWLSRLHQRPLNLVVDPATPLGVASLVASHRDTLTSLHALDQASKKDLQMALHDRKYATFPNVLTESGYCDENLAASDNFKSATKISWIPRVLHLRTLLVLVFYLISLTVGLAILKHYADLSKLYQTAFVYQASFSVFNKRLSTSAPYSIVPTIFAVAIGLWWDSLDKTFRTLQPYISLSKRSRSIAEGAGLSYQSSYWTWAAVKAAKNKHWLLLILTIGSTLSQVFIISMSALFEREPENTLIPGAAFRTIELRQVPQIDNVLLVPGYPKAFAAQVMSKAYSDLATNWIYTATIQLTLDGPEPAWSRQGWSFVPVDISALSNMTTKSLQQTVHGQDNPNEALISTANVSLTTTAIRGRVECSWVPDISNSSSWLMTQDLTNKTIWKVSSNPTNLKTGYELPRVLFPNSPWNSSALSHPVVASCCTNRSSDEMQDSAIGYWSPNQGGRFPFPSETWPINFTSKWILGPARTDYYQLYDNETGRPAHLLFTKVPEIQALNCIPIIETAEADIAVEQSTGHVYGYKILGNPVPAEPAWSDPFTIRASSSLNDTSFRHNVTTSYGILFVNTLLGAAQITQLSGSGQTSKFPFEDEYVQLEDKAFNVRDETKGLNLDFMSYAMYTMASKDPKALLDYDTLLNLTQMTFSTYFQHYVSSNYSLDDGGWVYQKIGEQPKDLQPPRLNNGSTGSPSVYPSLNTNRTAAVVVSKRIEVLRMNAVATWLSIGILIWLTLTTILIAALQRTYFSSLIRNIESLGDVLVLIAGSENLLRLVRDNDFEQLRKNQDVLTRLGWFQGVDGKKRWGLEVVGGDRPVTWINWYEDEQNVLRTGTAKSSRFESLRSRTKTFGL
ncbi:uncharacterized protein BDR25DRAFT_293541 [Lindgomyces ingoldianus]|uniref:Uncharacterized protein n=1 Tax=Lindgomyces ingoldianus TaxID=673940 RepID=A0ACB6QI47_9PLEO|nr:uncharacterized protein BDR25DRAFT_293541 [Lindgomyces ingoldianus]KAF2466614.1 hypothetical protein BDR25DRAFT_293541 [Lindgomyces ingoldianus]